MKNHSLASFGCFLFGLAIIVLVITCSGCRHPMPAIDVDFYAGDSEHFGISRSQENKTISCDDPQFDEYVCLSYDDLKKIFATMLKCKDWSNAELLTRKEKRRLYKENKTMIDHVLHQDSYERRQSLEPIQY